MVKAKKGLAARLTKPICTGLAGLMLLTSGGCATMPSPEQIARARQKLIRAYREDFPQTIDDVMRSKRLISYVENKEGDKMAFIWNTYQTPDYDFAIADKKSNKMIYGPSTKGITEYGVKKIDDKISFLEWEFSKYGDSPYTKGTVDKTSSKKVWEHSKAYTINWDGTGKEEVDKNKYYYYDPMKDGIYAKSLENE
jgi:hypothetical protein